MHTVKPIDVELIWSCAKETKFIFSLEEHVQNGGLASAVAFILASSETGCHFYGFHAPARFIDVAGTREYLCKKAGLSADIITQKILSTIKRRA